MKDEFKFFNLNFIVIFNINILSVIRSKIFLIETLGELMILRLVNLRVLLGKYPFLRHTIYFVSRSQKAELAAQQTFGISPLLTIFLISLTVYIPSIFGILISRNIN